MTIGLLRSTIGATTNNDTTATAKPSVTVIGLGAMGCVITSVLLQHGHPVTVWNRSPGADHELIGRGAHRAADVPSAVAASELVLLTVLDIAAVAAVLDAAGDSIRGRTVVNLVTGRPDEARTIEALVTQSGGTYLDGVMMAVPIQIGTPTATILYGGSASAFDQYRPVLIEIAGDSSRLGDDVALPALFDVALLTLLYATMSGWLQAFATVRAGGVTAAAFLPYATSWFDNVVIADDPTAIAAAIDERSYPDLVPSSLGLNAAALRMLHRVQSDVGVDTSIVAAISALAQRGVDAGHEADAFTAMIEAIHSPVLTAEVAE